MEESSLEQLTQEVLRIRSQVEHLAKTRGPLTTQNRPEHAMILELRKEVDALMTSINSFLASSSGPR